MPARKAHVPGILVFHDFDAARFGFAYPAVARIGPSVDYIEQAYDDSKYGRFSRRPVMTVMTPGGRISAASSANASADIGVCGDGLRMTALPVSSGAASAVAKAAIGWLKGSRRSTTP